MSKADNLTDFLKDLANAIREKKGSSSLINNGSQLIISIDAVIKVLQHRIECRLRFSAHIEVIGLGIEIALQPVFSVGIAQGGTVDDFRFHRFLLHPAAVFVLTPSFYHPALLFSMEKSKTGL